MSQTKPCIVFAHGLWADGSCFSKLIPTLQAEGYEVASSQHSLDTPKGDVATLLRTLGRVSSPAILVGHSYGGSVITAAGTDDRVAGLVPAANVTAQPYPAAPKGAVDVYVRQSVFPSCMANRLPASQARVLAATQRPLTSLALSQKGSSGVEDDPVLGRDRHC